MLGLYHQVPNDRPIIKLLKSLIPDQEAMIATMSHEIAHDLLLGAGLVTGEEADHEDLTDLLPVALGMGTFHSNTAVKQNSYQSGNMSYWSIRKSGYLTAAVCGYAMGVIEWLRCTTSPPSIAYLGADAAGAMREGHRYLCKTNDCLIDHDHPSRLTSDLLSPCDWLETSVSPSASQSLFALQNWFGSASVNKDQTSAALKLLQHREPDVQSAAIDVLTRMTDPPPSVIDSILDLFNSPSVHVCEKAVSSVATFQVPLTHVTSSRESLLDLLMLQVRDHRVGPAESAAKVLGSYGESAVDAVPHILQLLLRSFARNDDGSDALFESLQSIVGNLKTYLDANPRLLTGGQRELIEEHLLARSMRRGVAAQRNISKGS